ncbi:hypothetical protein [Arenimonas oryziterrae]|uniref:Lipoprotein n=1 Tax=Arenimonas oryziterrae DSM 21050 = YC6267 TaxID=1121015 RepID=A0A091AQZ0_9GAMM|nr:hypothetical protein [Arenimonas oryziterrae]KFN41409.1 hypothetical protein N789_05905 [Arenimonas oryziterrae DSM 21050 = YC6267]
MKMPTKILFFLTLALAPACATACRQLQPDVRFELAQTVVVGWVSSATMQDLESLPPGSDDFAAFDKVIDGNRDLRIVVTETRKGHATNRLSIKVGLCTGSFINAGQRVIAYQSTDGSWSVSDLPMDSAEK